MHTEAITSPVPRNQKKMKEKTEKRDTTPLKTRKKVTNKFLILCLEMKCQIFGKEKAIPFSKMQELFPKKLQELRSSWILWKSAARYYHWRTDCWVLVKTSSCLSLIGSFSACSVSWARLHKWAEGQGANVLFRASVSPLAKLRSSQFRLQT